jgi:hypothetical protein
MLLSVTAYETYKHKKMKKIGLIILLLVIAVQGFGQETPANRSNSGQEASATDTSDVLKVVVGQELIIVEDGKEALKVKVGSRGLTILDALEGDEPKFQFQKFEEDVEPDRKDNFTNPEEDRADRRKRFKGHWSGVEFGYNNFTTSDYSLNMPENIDYMSLHSGKSHNFNINFCQLSLGLGRRIGFVTGLGFNWNNYRFDGNNNIQKGANGIIEKLDPGVPLKKSKLSTLYLDLPLMLEIQIPADQSHINIAAGPVGAVKLSSGSKMVYEDRDKVKSDDDFSLNMLRYGATARVGFENIHISGTYYFTPLFKTGKGPGGIDLYPFEIGLAFTID